MRPRCFDEVVGQSELLGPDGPLRAVLGPASGLSLILWGPPGSGKTTLARLAASERGERFVALSAVSVSVRELREIIAESAAANRAGLPRALVFLDEIHRFNRAQQDTLLPAVEDGSIALIGATTENPSFTINDALLSRVRIFCLKRIGPADLKGLLKRAWCDAERGLGRSAETLPDAVIQVLARHGDGDARRSLTALETLAVQTPTDAIVSLEDLDRRLGDASLRFDRHADAWHELISALHKSVRGSDPDAALYWLTRMLAAGCPPEYLGRRLLRMAYEDIGLAAPQLAQTALTAWQTVERLGKPEGELALAQVTIQLALAEKSNAAYRAFKAAQTAQGKHGSAPVPAHLINAVTHLDRDLDRGYGYAYDHDSPDGVAWAQSLWPDTVTPEQYLAAPERHADTPWAQRLAWLRSQRENQIKKGPHSKTPSRS